MVGIEIGHARRLQRGLGIGIALRAVVHGVVVAQARQLHPAQGQDGGKIRRALEVEGFFHPVQLAVAKNALQVHHGDIVAVQQGLEVLEGVIVSLAQRGLNKATAAVGRLAFPAQRAVAQKAQRHLAAEAADLHGRLQQRLGRIVGLKHIPLRAGRAQSQRGAGRQTGGGISNPHDILLCVCIAIAASSLYPGGNAAVKLACGACGGYNKSLGCLRGGGARLVQTDRMSAAASVPCAAGHGYGRGGRCGGTAGPHV